MRIVVLLAASLIGCSHTATNTNVPDANGRAQGSLVGRLRGLNRMQPLSRQTGFTKTEPSRPLASARSDAPLTTEVDVTPQ